MKRYAVVRCDEGGTLFDSDGNEIDHTWDVVDRSDVDDAGYPSSVQNCGTRETARAVARELNQIEATAKFPKSADVAQGCVPSVD